MFPCGKRILDTVSILNLCHPVILIPDAFLCILYLHHLISIVINLDLYKDCMCILDLNHIIMSSCPFLSFLPPQLLTQTFLGSCQVCQHQTTQCLDLMLPWIQNWQQRLFGFETKNHANYALYTNLLVTCWSLWRLKTNMFFWNHKKIPWNVLKILI